MIAANETMAESLKAAGVSSIRRVVKAPERWARIVALAQSLGLKVVAEGVETDAQREFLVRIGCDMLQGYLFSAPRPPDQIEPMLRKQFEMNGPLLARSA
jgi:EAL domain-containing protein (putative c-di-GMP-specific phosphodiesterase class I)